MLGGARAEDLDVVLEGTATWVTDDETLAGVAAAYRSKYGWRVEARDGALRRPLRGADGRGPPYAVYRITPAQVFGFGTDDALGPRTARWRVLITRRVA